MFCFNCTTRKKHKSSKEKLTHCNLIRCREKIINNKLDHLNVKIGEKNYIYSSNICYEKWLVNRKLNTLLV